MTGDPPHNPDRDLHGETSHEPSRPAPRRWHYAAVAGAYTAFAIYGSLVPLRWTPMPWDVALERFSRVPWLHLSIEHRADWVANLLLFMPLTFAWMGAATLDRSARAARWIAATVIAAAACGLSFALEFTQLWFPPRTVSQNDIAAETLGGVLGVVAWLAIGQGASDRLRAYTSDARPLRQADWMLQAYALGFLIYGVLPLDLTLSLTEIARKYKEGRVILVPFLDVLRQPVSALIDLAQDLAVFVPVGLLVATWGAPARRPVRPLAVTLLLGALVAAGIEAAQLLVYSRYTTTRDVLVGLLGAGLAWPIARWYWGRGAEKDGGAAPRVWPALLVAAAGLHACLIAAASWAPFRFTRDPAIIRARLRGMWRTPFSSLYWGSEFHAVGQVLTKLLWFAPLGALGVMTIASASMSLPLRRWLSVGWALGCLACAVGVELGQVLLPDRVADATDAGISFAGALLGMAAASRLVSPGGVGREASGPARAADPGLDEPG